MKMRNLERFDVIFYYITDIITNLQIDDIEKCNKIVEYSSNINIDDRGEIRTYLTAIKPYLSIIEQNIGLNLLDKYKELAKILNDGTKNLQ